MDSDDEAHEEAPGTARPARVTRTRRTHYYSLRVGSTLGQVFSIWFKNLIPFTALALLIGSPLVALLVVLIAAGKGMVDELAFDLINQWGASMIGFVLSGALAYAVFEQLRGRSVGLAEAASVGLRRLLPVIGTGILVSLGVGLGMLACIVPGIVLQCALIVAVPACVVERPGVIASLKRSFELTKGNRWPIFGLSLLTGLLIVVAGVALGGTLAGFGDWDGETITSGVGIVLLLFSLVMSPLSAVLHAVIYHNLRVGKEGVEVEELMSVFE